MQAGRHPRTWLQLHMELAHAHRYITLLDIPVYTMCELPACLSQQTGASVQAVPASQAGTPPQFC